MCPSGATCLPRPVVSVSDDNAHPTLEQSGHFYHPVEM